jgi:hypothetical protein
MVAVLTNWHEEGTTTHVSWLPASRFWWPAQALLVLELELELKLVIAAQLQQAAAMQAAAAMCIYRHLTTLVEERCYCVT